MAPSSAALIDNASATHGSSGAAPPWTGSYTPPVDVKCLIVGISIRTSAYTGVTATFDGIPLTELASYTADGSLYLWFLNDPPVGGVAKTLSIEKASGASAQVGWCIAAFNAKRLTTHTPVVAKTNGFNNLSQNITPDTGSGFIFSQLMHENAVGPTPTNGQTNIFANNGFGWARNLAYKSASAGVLLNDSWDNGNLDHGSLMSTYLAFGTPATGHVVSFGGMSVL
jgi:hypothetical protein